MRFPVRQPRSAFASAFVFAVAALICPRLIASRVTGAAYDPLAMARTEKARGHIDNVLAHIPAQCYTRTDGVSNPCWTCHTDKNGRNANDDWALQAHYQFNQQGRANHWTNLFVDRRPAMAEISDQEALRYVREDNYKVLRAALSNVSTADLPWKPDLDLDKGFDSAGFARDGSGWRAFRYKPFPGTFWPTNGSTDEVFIRLPVEYRQDAEGQPSIAVYKANLAIVEAAVAVPDTRPVDQLNYPIEPVDETAAGLDLDGDGRISGMAESIRALPPHYAGGAGTRTVYRYDYPVGTEFLHTVRYLDPKAADFMATRLKELRYSHKLFRLSDSGLKLKVEEDAREQSTGGWPYFGGDAFTGMFNEYGWRLQGYIEDANGRLRLQTREEQVYCMGCHAGIGVTVDGSFSLPRKVPGAKGWGRQSLAGIRDVPQAGSDQPEIERYFERVHGGDEFRANAEVLTRYFHNGQLNREIVQKAAPGGARDIRSLIVPSPTRALLLDKAYMALVPEQSFQLGRDAPISPVDKVYRMIEGQGTGLEDKGRVWHDGRIWLDWPKTR